MTVFDGPEGRRVDTLPILVSGIAEVANQYAARWDELPNAAKITFADQMTVVARLIREKVNGKPEL